LKRGYASCVGLPLLNHQGAAFGALTIYASQPGAFIAEEIRYLEQLSADLAFGILALRERRERERVDAALKESEERLRMAAQAASVGVFSFDLVANKAVWSPELMALHGLKLGDELAHKEDKVPAAVLEEDRPVFLAAMASANDPSGNGVMNVEFRIRRADGQVRWLMVRAKTTFTDNAPIQPSRAAGVVIDITERKRAEKELEETKAILCAAIDQSTAGAAIARAPDGVLSYMNDAGLRICRTTREAVLNKVGISQYVETWQMRSLDGAPLRAEDVPLARAIMYGENNSRECRIRGNDGSDRIVLVTAAPIDTGKKVIAGIVVFLDITERKTEELERGITLQLLSLVNTENDLRHLAQKLTLLLRDWSGCQSVGIRLKDGNDFPYFETLGFAPEFVGAENRLCALDAAGRIVKDSKGNPVLECMCGTVLCGRFNPSQRFFTARGSFWTNSATELLASTTPEERQTKSRGRCYRDGYESVALIPLKTANEVIGLLQFNDRQKGKFEPERIALFERLADNISSAVAHLRDLEALRQSEEWRRKLIAIAMDGFFCTDTEGRLEEVNEAYCRMSGYSREELLEMTIFDLDAGKPRGEIARHRMKISKEGQDRFETRHRRKDGSVFDVEISVQSLDKNGERHFAFLRDITEQNLAQAALKESERKFRGLFETMSEGMALHEMLFEGDGRRAVDYRILNCNAAFERHTGLSATEAKGKLASQFYGTNPAPFLEVYAEVVRTGQSRTFEIFYPPLTRHFLISIFVPKPGHFATVFLDMTERRNAEESLKLSQQRLALAADAAGMGVWDWDILQNKMTWDDKMFRLYGITEKPEHYGVEMWQSRVHPEDRARATEASQAAVRGEKPYDVEFRVAHSDSSLHYLKAHGIVLRDESGKAVRMLGVNYDITNRKRAESELIASRSQLRALALELCRTEQRERRQIADLLHDDVIQSLALARINSGALLAKLVDKELKSLLIHIQADIEQAIDRSRSMMFELSPPVLRELGLKPALEWLAEQTSEKHGLECDVSCDPARDSLDSEVRNLVFSAVRELISNVVKHAHAHKASITVRQTSDSLEIVVKDDGVGFDRSKIEALPGQQGGFGLFSIRERVQHLGGRCEMRSGSEQGASFAIIVPLEKK